MVRGQFGVALGGGGARGFAHIGVLCAMDAEGIRPDLIVGTSMGAMIGGLYAHYGSAQKIYDHFHTVIADGDYDASTYARLVQMEMTGDQSFLAQVKRFFMTSVTFGKTLFRPSIIPVEEYVAGINTLIPDVRIEELSLPFACIALDLHSAEEVVIRRGSLRRAVMASCAIPGIYPPVEEGGMLLVDGGWIDRTPVPAARRLGATQVLAVDVSHGIFPATDLDTAMNLILRSNLIAVDRLDLMQVQGADLCLRPELDNFHSLDFEQLDRIVQVGYRCAQDARGAIRRLCRKAGRRRWISAKRHGGEAFAWPADFKFLEMTMGDGLSPEKSRPAEGA
ncbi:MAG: patatin-like phospholipase family protein [Acidobacteria bacterium]|nr:patatin-like phospholipase family protein [Acidobacteriota bacterium]